MEDYEYNRPTRIVYGDEISTSKVSMCVKCKHCDIAVTCGTTAVVNCIARNTIVFNSRVAWCRLFEQRDQTPFEKEKEAALKEIEEKELQAKQRISKALDEAYLERIRISAEDNKPKKRKAAKAAAQEESNG